MSSISDTAHGSARLPALDHLRGFVVALVVLHHSVLAYCRFGHFDRRYYLLSSAPIVDAERWAGFDIIVLLNDSFFMPLMFLLSGLFVWQGLVRKGPGRYVGDRLLRLGLPFAAAVLTVIPLAYYPSYLMTGADIGFGQFWAKTVFSGPWPSGPPWFVGVLLAFDCVAALLFAIVRRWSGEAASPTAFRPIACFAALVVLSAFAYLPLLAVFGPSRWLSIGPFAVQASRIALYMAYFLAGIVLGRHGMVVRADALPRRWASWTLLAVVAAIPVTALPIARLQRVWILSPLVWSALAGVALVVFCAAACFALIAVFQRFSQRRQAAWDSLSRNAYGIFLLHYPIVTWVQYGLLTTRVTVVGKATLVLLAAMLLSWGGAMLLCRVPGIRRVV